jgi:hypothetical protein
VQPDQLAQVGETNAFAVARNFLEDRKGATERLYADPLPVLGIVVDVGLQGFYEPCDRRFCWCGRLFRNFGLGSRSHRVVSKRTHIMN